MAVGRSKRIVIEVDDVALKRRLYSALSEDGRSLKDWFVASVDEYLVARIQGKQLELPGVSVAEDRLPYQVHENKQ